MIVEGPYRSRALAEKLAGAIQEEASTLPTLSIMHVCGTHEHEIVRHGLRRLLPPGLQLAAGPGCPVCITPASAVMTAIGLAGLAERPILCTYGDLFKVPAQGRSLATARAEGADIRIVYGPREAVRVAQENRDRHVVFFSIGFETTAAPVAALVEAGLPDNLLLYCCHRYVPAAVEALAAGGGGEIAGFLLPGHASVITGTRAYGFLAEQYGMPSAVAGFEPVDILAGMISILRQIAAGTPVVANCYSRAVQPNGNAEALAALSRVFRRTDAAWRGIGTIPGSGLVLDEKFESLDALARLGFAERSAPDRAPGCLCHRILVGVNQPRDCPLFAAACTPDDPIGPCMVGSEGTCRTHYLYPEHDDV